MFYDVTKRIIDIVSALAVGLVFSPIIILTAVAIKFDSPGPIIYKAKRVGKNGRVFGMWKFRSMVEDADSFLLKHPEYMRQLKGKEGWKFGEAKDDPRVTRVGRFIRRLSIDELPQLWNILVGDMSIVGPRPYRKDMVGDEIREQLKLYPHLKSDLDVALSVKPGVSGPWQTSGRNELPWDKRVELDAAYARQRSLLADIIILLRTPFHMINRW